MAECLLQNRFALLNATLHLGELLAELLLLFLECLVGEDRALFLKLKLGVFQLFFLDRNFFLIGFAAGFELGLNVLGGV